MIRARMREALAVAGLLVTSVVPVGCDSEARTVEREGARDSQVVVAPPPAPWLTEARRLEEDSLYAEAARGAWQFANRNYIPATGFTKPFDSYPIGTVWDLTSGLAAEFCAAELGLISRAEFDQRITRALETLGALPLYEGIGFNKEYVFTSGSLINVERQPARTGYGVSATDSGRLLLWLRIIANRYPSHREAVERIVRRLVLGQLVSDGYLRGYQLSKRTGRVRPYQEGRIGYEQYAARGFQVWGVEAERALDVNTNAEPRTLYGVTVPHDRRGGERLTSEPFVLLGMEAGWTPAQQAIAKNLVAVQEARFRQSDTLTMVSEDAIDIPPHYFFYYAVLGAHGPFSIEVQRGVRLTQPRWLSTKASFAWHALLPGDYTRRVLDYVRTRARVSEAWGAGVYENGRSTGHPNLNTNTVVLEAAAYRRLGQPFLSLAALPATGSP